MKDFSLEEFKNRKRTVIASIDVSQTKRVLIHDTILELDENKFPDGCKTIPDLLGTLSKIIGRDITDFDVEIIDNPLDEMEGDEE